MTTAYYPGANLSLDFTESYKGDLMDPDKVLLHTTEGTTLVDYSKGAEAPNITARPNFAKKRLDWFQHYAFNRSARALVNKAGGVETNTEDVVQVELIGTCDPAHRKTWGKLQAGVHYIFWPEAPGWALDDLADFLAWQNVKNGVPLTTPKEWLPYPSSYGNSRVRMTFAEWRTAKGVLGHMHPPENVHGDPGNIAIAALLSLARVKAAALKGSSTGGGTSTPAPKPKPTAPPAFPGREFFGPGKSNKYIKQLGERLVRKGFGKHYRVGPSKEWGEADRLNVRDFQLSRPELRGDADGMPGPLTWRLLFS